ncbi:MAG: LysR family transcriptional regulator [Alphaproteobacteria bacterium]|nr:LysR family transcriptional regulator [Alphaproteobacteria bacterium]
MAIPSQLTLRLEIGDAVRLGPGKVRLLELIEANGSITAAAREMGMSYRHAWLLVDSLNGAFREPLVETRAGGKADRRAAVTSLGRDVLARFRAMQALAQAALAEDLAVLEAQLRPDAAPRHMRDPEHSG